ncbi:MAG: ABC transporter substrate-binding protein [Methanogenium sp.]
MKRSKSTIILIILAAVVFCCGCTGTDAPADAQNGVQENAVGVLLTLSGDYADAGESGQVALEVATVDINDYFASIGSDHRVRLVIKDTQTDPAIALEKLQEFDKEDIKFVIGPGSSAELEAIRAYADEHGIIVISPLSSAPSLAIANDNVFRFVSPDTYQADAMAYYLEETGITAIVPISRDDIWGNELRSLAAKAFEKHGGTVLDGVVYAPNTEDYTTVVAELDRKVGQAIQTHGKKSVGVYALTFDEAKAIMEAASETGNLTQVQWYGCDGNILLSSLTTPGVAARFAEQTKFTAPMFGDTHLNPGQEATNLKIEDKLGRQPIGSSLVSYDTLWIVAMVCTQTDSKDVSELKTALVKMAKTVNAPFFGLVELDAAGDRSTAHYSFLSVKKDGTAYQWVAVAQYDLWTQGQAPTFTLIPA